MNEDIETYLICEKFHRLPSEVDRERRSEIAVLMGIYDIVLEESKRKNRKAALIAKALNNP